MRPVSVLVHPTSSSASFFSSTAPPFLTSRDGDAKYNCPTARTSSQGRQRALWDELVGLMEECWCTICQP
jgi:hypothetical protein